MSLTTIKIMMTKRIAIPIAETMFFTLGGISFLKIPSTAITNKCHPSSPGNGKRLIIPKLTEISPQ